MGVVDSAGVLSGVAVDLQHRDYDDVVLRCFQRCTCVWLVSVQRVRSTTVRRQIRDVYGRTMAKCDRSVAHGPNPGFQTTGYFRDNYCTASSSDAGSHYVCVNLPNATIAGKPYSPFWVVPGQARSPDDAASYSWPKPGPWCICMSAYARMLESHPEFSQMLTCEATNEWVIEDYNIESLGQCRALNTVCERCSVQDDAAKDSLLQKCKAAAAKCGSKSSDDPIDTKYGFAPGL